MNKKIDIIEVGPRDGFQSVKCAMITTEQKLQVIDDLVAAGVKHIEISDACTMCEPDRFWSHRVTKGDRGSQGAIIVCGGAKK